MRGGDEQGVRALIGDFDIVFDGIIDFDLLHGHKTSNAVVFVDNQIAGGKVRKGIQLLPVCRRLPGRCPALGFRFGNELSFRQHGELA